MDKGKGKRYKEGDNLWRRVVKQLLGIAKWHLCNFELHLNYTL